MSAPWTRAQVVSAFQRFDTMIGRSPTVGDTAWTTPSWRSRMSPERLKESARAAELGLRLPYADTVTRLFGSWTAGLDAAGLEPVSQGAKRAERKGRGYDRVQVCPSCGDFSWLLDPVTGWCRACTRELGRAA